MKIKPEYIVKKSLLGGYDVIHVALDVFKVQNTTKELAQAEANKLNWDYIGELFRVYSQNPKVMGSFKSITINK